MLTTSAQVHWTYFTVTLECNLERQSLFIIHAHVCMHVYVLQECIHVGMYIDIHTLVCMCMYVYTCQCVYAYM